MAERLPRRWAFKHGAYYYRPAPGERDLFDGKTWYRLGKAYPAALREFARIKEVEAGEHLSGAIDRYIAERLPRLKPSTQDAYLAACERLRRGLGHNRVGQIRPRMVYQYMDAVAKARTMNIANVDLKVLNTIMDCCVRWGIIERNPIKKEVAYYGVKDGLKRADDTYVEDWQLAEWAKVADPQQRAFAALVMLIGTRKSDTLRIMESNIGDTLKVHTSKTEKPMEFELTPAVQAVIDEARAAKRCPSLYLFPNSRGGCYVSAKGRSQSFDERWRESMRKAIRETDLEAPFTRKDLRAKVGSDLETDRRAQELLGHSSVGMTRRHYRRGKRVIRPVK